MAVWPAAARAWDPSQGGLARTPDEAAKLRWLLTRASASGSSLATEGAGPSASALLAELEAPTAAEPIHARILRDAYARLAADAATIDGRSGLPPLAVLTAASPDPDARAASWNPWLADGTAPDRAGADYARLVGLLATPGNDPRRAEVAASLAHVLADVVSAKHADAFTLDAATLATLTDLAARWTHAPHASLDEWLASPLLGEAIQAVERRVAALAGGTPANAAAYWQRVTNHLGTTGGTTLLTHTRPGALGFLAIPPSTLRTALAAYLLHLAERPQDAHGAPDATFDPFAYNGPLVEAAGDAPTFELAMALSEHVVWETNAARGAAAGGRVKAIAGTAKPESLYLPWHPAPGFGSFDETRNEQALRATLAELTKRCAAESHGAISDPRDFEPAFEPRLERAIRCVATALRGSLSALRAEAHAAPRADGAGLRIRLDLTNRASSTALLRQARIALRTAAGGLETRPDWVVDLGGRALTGPAPLCVGVTVEGIPAGAPIADLVVDVQADFGALPDTGRVRATAAPSEVGSTVAAPPPDTPASGTRPAFWGLAIVLALVALVLGLALVRRRTPPGTARGLGLGLPLGHGLGLALALALVLGLAVLFIVLATAPAGTPIDAQPTASSAPAPRDTAPCAIELAARGTGPLAALAPLASLAPPPPTPALAPGPPPKPLPDFAALERRWRSELVTPDGTAPDLVRAALFDPLLRFVPPSAWFVLGLDLQAVRQAPPALRALLPRAVRAADGTGWLALLGVADLALDPGGPPAAVVAATPEAAADPNQALFVVGGATTPRPSLEQKVRAIKPDARLAVDGIVPVWTLGAAALALDAEAFLLAGLGGFRAVLAARAGDCILWSGALAPLLRQTRMLPVAHGLAAYLVAIPPPEVQQALGTFLPELASLQRARVVISVGQGLSVDARLELPDPNPLAQRLLGMSRDAALLTAGASTRWLTVTTASSGDATLGPTTLHLVLTVPEASLSVAAMLLALVDF